MTLTAPLGENSVLREFAERGQAAQAAADKAVADAEAQTKEEQQNMGKEDIKEGKVARDYTQVEKRAVLEATRGLGERAMQAEARKLGIGKSTIYMWRKELWGTGNAYGIADKKAAAGPAAGRGGPHRSEEEKRRIVEEAYAYPGGLSGYHAKHGVADASIRRWAKELGIEKPEIEKVTSSGKHIRTAGEKLRILAEADAHPGGVRAYAAAATANGVSADVIYQWRAAQKTGRLKAADGPSHGATKATPGAAKVASDGRLYRTDAEKLRHVAAAEKHPGGFRGYGGENGISPSSLDKWRGQRDRGELTASDAIRGPGVRPAKVEAAPDAEIVERYEQERALKRMSRPGPDPRDAKIKALEIENLALKVNVRAAMMAGYLSFLDVDSMFSGKKG